MRIFKQLDELPPFQKAVITIGTFDGVHLAHRQIIARVCEIAQQTGGESVLITFHPHPRSVVSGGADSVALLSPLSEKLALLAQTGLQNVAVITFTPEFAEQSPEQYIAEFLYRYFQPHYIVIGYDHRYGKNREGGLDLLLRYGTKLGFHIEKIPKKLIDDIAISSTKIRQSLTIGDIDTATSLLGYHYTLTGTVVQGKKLGRSIGFPTANIQLNETDKLLPAQGVYAVQVLDKGILYDGMLNIGTRPTVGGTNISIEVYLFHFPPDHSLYGCEISISCYRYIRPEQKFDSIAALKTQLIHDQTNIEAYLAQNSSTNE